jgi:hypothetical protein
MMVPSATRFHTKRTTNKSSQNWEHSLHVWVEEWQSSIRALLLHEHRNFLFNTLVNSDITVCYCHRMNTCSQWRKMSSMKWLIHAWF